MHQAGGIDTDYVRTYYWNVNLTLSVDDDVIQRARRRADSLGNPHRDAAEFEKLSRLARGKSHGWRFNRDEIHERK